MAARKPSLKKEHLLIHSHAHTPQTQAILKGLSQDATDYVGRTVSDSAIVRALLRYASLQERGWARMHIFPFAEEEIMKGMVWGKKKS